MALDILFFLCLVAFLAGFIDAIAGGGGLIQTPLGLALLSTLPVATVIGSLKVPAFTGTAIAVTQYLKKAQVYWKYLVTLALLSFGSAFLGSHMLTIVSNEFMKPLLLVILVLLWIFTYVRKDFVRKSITTITSFQRWLYGAILAIVIGFYDGFIGPATGTFFLMGFIFLIGMDFFQASAYAKLINLATNIGSIVLFSMKGQIIWSIALPMAVCNGLGGFVGARMAILKGQQWVRYIFLFIMFIAIVRFGYDVLF